MSLNKAVPLFLIFFFALFNYNMQAAIPINNVAQQIQTSNSKIKQSYKRPNIVKRVKRLLSLVLPDDNVSKIKPTDGFAILGFLIGLVGLFYAGLIFGSLGLLTSALALHNINNSERHSGRGIAIAGMIVGAIAILGALFALFFLSS